MRWLDAIERTVTKPMPLNDATIKTITSVMGSTAATAKDSIVYWAGKSDMVAMLKIDNVPWLVPKGMLKFITNTAPSGTTPTSSNLEDYTVGNLYHGVDVREVDEDHKQFIPKGIPTGYVEHQGENKAISIAVRESMPLLFEGPTGCGKTAAVLDFAARINQPAIRVSVSREIDEFALLGKWIKAEVEGQILMVWLDGPVTMAMRNGYWLVLDEVNTGDPAVLVQLHSIFDNGTIVLTGKDSELVEAHPNFRIFGAINPSAEGYAGTVEMNKATLGRFLCAVEMGYLPSSLEQVVIQDQAEHHEPDLASKMVKFANVIRRASSMEADQMINFPVSTRDLIAAMKLTKHYGVKDAIEMAVIAKANSEEKTYIRDQFENVFGM